MWYIGNVYYLKEKNDRKCNKKYGKAVRKRKKYIKKGKFEYSYKREK